jgi:WD40 repeat protein
VNTISFTHDGKKLISGSDDCKIIVWDLKLAQCLKIIDAHDDAVTTIDISNND